MKILIIDRDALTTQLMTPKLEAAGHDVVIEPVKNNALELMGQEEFHAVYFDPTPLNNARPIVLGIRRAARNYPYIVLMSSDLEREDAIKGGANDILTKPLDASRLDEISKNAERLTALVDRIGDESEDFPSAGGVIAKSAFNQLFLSSMDRADRYGEQAYYVFIGIKNYNELVELDGPQAAGYASAKLSQYLVRLRRQSDIIAQTGKNEYCLMLQRPVYESEPIEAASRFVDALGKMEDIVENGAANVEVYVKLIALPVGNCPVSSTITYNEQGAELANS